jgi:hypothetical protein
MSGLGSQSSIGLKACGAWRRSVDQTAASGYPAAGRRGKLVRVTNVLPVVDAPCWVTPETARRSAGWAGWHWNGRPAEPMPSETR